MSSSIYSDRSLGPPIDLDSSYHQEEVDAYPPGLSQASATSALAYNAEYQIESQQEPQRLVPKGKHSSTLEHSGYHNDTIQSSSLWVTQEQFSQKTKCDGCAGQLPCLAQTLSTIFQNSKKVRIQCMYKLKTRCVAGMCV